ncbi:nucleoside monophosphate kinase [Candidatus Saccharibacteria bacterium]|jgi:adenylate kinase|nr:nucleoside monophosphate kinase [Candidatus Saccharibacteria bacterium]MBP9131869.1 nucleoside monophosphate kinase [Candidatus Saccharibacteria bacterium]
MIVLLGPIGAGKSVQAQILVDNYGYKWISTGEMLRNTTDQRVRDLLNSGQLVDDKTVRDLLLQEISKTDVNQDIIIDGFPRRVSQADWLSEKAKDLKREVDHVLHVVLSEDTAAKRMEGRGRHDDSTEAMHARNKAYRDEVLPVINYYAKKDIVHEIDGAGTVEEVSKLIKDALGK